MIQKITEIDAVYAAIDTNRDIYTEKIRALADAYGCGYDFCNFYKQTGGTVIADYYGSAVAAKCSVRTGDRLAELMEFLMCGKFRKVLMPAASFGAAKIDANIREMLLMRYNGVLDENEIKNTDDTDKLLTDPGSSLGEISEIVTDGFDIDINKWYTDISHNLRHGISQIYVLENTACAVKMFSSSGITYLSYISTRKEARGNGCASRLIRAICVSETAKRNAVLLFCDPSLENFYERLDFTVVSKAVELTI